MRFIEAITPMNSPTKISSLADFGAISFGKGITDKNKAKTPHYEMERGIQMYENNSIVNSGINQLSLFIIPNSKLKCWSSDKKSMEWFQTWLDYRANLIEEIRNSWITKSITGQQALEKFYTKNGKKIDNYSSLNDVSRLYYNPNHKEDKSDMYIYKLKVGTKVFLYKGERKVPDFYNVPYYKNGVYEFRRVYGAPIHGDEIIFRRVGWSRDNMYGRSPLASAIDDDNVMREILSGWDTISKTRQLDRKILSVDDAETGAQFSSEKMDEIAEKIDDSESSFTLLNFPLKTATTDISVSGKYDLMEGVYDIARRKLMMSLLPTYLTPWNDSGTTQGAEASMPPFLARIKSEQNSLINFLNNAIIDEVREQLNPSLADDLTFVFDEPQILSDEYYIRKVTDLVREEVLNKEQAQKILINVGVLDAGIFEEDEDKQDDDSRNDGDGNDAPEDDNDINDDNTSGSDDSGSEQLLEAYQVKKTGFTTFKKKLQKHTKEKLNFKGWSQVDSMHKIVGGKQARVIETNDEWLLYDGLRLKQSFDKDLVTKDAMKKIFEDYTKKLKELQNRFLDEETDEDKLVDEMQQTLQKELQDRLKQITKLIDDNTTENESFSEKFLSADIFPKIDSIFKGFNTKLNSTVTKITNKLGANVIDDKDENIETSDDFKKMVDERKKLIKDNLKNQVADTKDSMVNDIKHSMRQGIMAGKSVSDIKSDVKKNFDYNKKIEHKFNRIVHTTTRQSSMLLKLRKWLDAGFESYVWQTREDSKVRPDHDKKNERVYDIKKSLKSNNMDAYPGKDFNCRCTAYPYE